MNNSARRTKSWGRRVYIGIAGILVGWVIIFNLPEGLDASGFANIVSNALTKIMLTCVALAIGVGSLVLLRRAGDYPSELEKIGSDLNVYGLGVSLSLFVGKYHGLSLLDTIEIKGVALLITVVGLVFSGLFYHLNLYLSKQIRELPGAPCSGGIHSFEELDLVLRDTKGKKILFQSLALGFVPSLILTIADLFKAK